MHYTSFVLQIFLFVDFGILTQDNQFQQLMNNQICPWRSDSESLIFDNNSVLFQSAQITKSSSVHKIQGKLKRPLSTEAYKINKTQKKLIRPVSCQINFKTTKRSHEQKQDPIRIHFITQIETPVRKSLAAKIPINEINFQASPGKRLKRNVSAVYSGYSNFSKQKIKKADNPTAILSKNIMVLRHKQKNNDEIYLNRRLASVLKLTKYAITSEIKQQMHKKMVIVKQNQKQKQKPKQKQVKNQAFKKAGFVYYNQSFMQNFQMKFS